MRLIVAGATGYLGNEVLRQALDRGYEVTALLREQTPEPAEWEHPKLTIHRAELAHEGWSVGLPKQDAIISCIASRQGGIDDAWLVDYGANNALLDWAEQDGAMRFIMMSAICVQKPRLAFQYAKKKFEDELLASSLHSTIIRPTAFYKSLSGQISRVQQGKSFMVFDGGNQTACKPISMRDLAQYTLRQLDDSSSFGRTLPIGGPGPAITPREQGELLARLCQQKSRIQSVSSRLFDVGDRLLQPLSGLSTWARDKAEFFRIAKYYAQESMLVWDPKTSRYDASLTPETGSDTLGEFYESVIKHGAVMNRAHHQLFGG